MTAPYLGFLSSPDYQKRIAKLKKNERAILSTLLVDTDEAEREMKRQLTLMELGQQREEAEKGLGLKEKGITTKYELGKESLAVKERMTQAGLAQRGELERQGMTTREDITRQRIGSEVGLREQELEYEAGQLPWLMGIGVGQVAAGGYLGYKKMQQDEELSKRYSDLLKYYGGKP